MRIALVGCGFIGRTHSHALRALRRAGHTEDRVTTTWDVDAGRAARFAEAHDGARPATDLAGALDDVDAVWICTPTSSHLEAVREAVRRGLAVFCEKPLAPTYDESKQLADVLTGAGVPSQVGLVLRFAPVFQQLHAALTDPGLGRVMTATLRDDQFFPNQGQYASTWRADVSVAGGGALIEHSIHDLDVLAWLLGSVKEVSAETANFAGHAGIEDLASVRMTHDSGVVSTLVTLWHQIMSRPSGRRLEVFCEKGLLWLDEDQVGPLHVEDANGSREIGPDAAFRDLAASLPVPPEWQESLAVYAAADLAFLRAVESGGTPGPSVTDALKAHAVVDAVYRSAGRGRVHLAYA